MIRQKHLLEESSQKVGRRPNAGQTKFDQETAAKTDRSERAVRVEVVKQKKELKAKLAHNSEPYRPSEGLFQWRLPNYDPDQVNEVEVRFEASPAGTRVTLEHRGFDRLPVGHPARHGLQGRAFMMMIGQWWGDQLGILKTFAGNSNKQSRDTKETKRNSSDE